MEENKKPKKSVKVVLIIILILIILDLLGFIFYDSFLGSKLYGDVDKEDNIGNDTEKEKVLDVTSDEVTRLLDKITKGVDMYCGNYEYLKDKKVVASDYSNDLVYKFALYQLISEKIAYDSSVTTNGEKTFTAFQLESKISALFGKNYKYTHETYSTCPRWKYSADTKQYVPDHVDCGGGCGPVHIMTKVAKAVKNDTSITLTVKAIFPEEVSGTVTYYADYLKTKKLELRLYDYTLNYEDSNFKDASTYKVVFTLEDGNYVFTSSEPIQ